MPVQEPDAFAYVAELRAGMRAAGVRGRVLRDAVRLLLGEVPAGEVATWERAHHTAVVRAFTGAMARQAADAGMSAEEFRETAMDGMSRRADAQS